jgi:DNA-binding CsgD family transcriptional regulator
MTTRTPAGTTALVGRDRELDLLRAKLDRARAGTGSLVLLAGEPGIGKTRLLQALADAARACGVQVLWGRCYEGGWAPPFSPWAEIIGEYARQVEPERLRQELGAAAPSLAQSVPAIRAVLPDTPHAVPLSPEEERFRLYDAAAYWLRSVSQIAPVLLVLDDLHWSGGPSLQLLQYVARSLDDQGILIVGAYRDVELSSGDPLANALPALLHDPGFERLPLKGLSRAAVAGYLAVLAGHEVSGDLAGAIYAETDGSPFFAGELLRLLLEEGVPLAHDAPRIGELAVPESVRHVVGRRLARLTPATQQMLRRAAGFSAGFDFSVLQRLTGLSEDALLTCIDDALAAQLIHSVHGGTETYDFVHAIVRHTLYEALSPSRRSRLHRQIATALEQTYAGRESTHAAELAVQYHASLGLPGAEAGYRFALLAAEQAKAASAHERAARFLGMARDLAVEAGPAERAAVLSKLAVAQAEALLLDDVQQTAKLALAALAESAASAAESVTFLTLLVGALKEAGASSSIWRPLLEHGLVLAGSEHTLSWARLVLLLDPVQPLANDRIRAGVWLELDPEAVAIARSDGEEDFARTLRQWNWKSVEETRSVLALVRGWREADAILRAMSKLAAAFVYRHGAFSEATACCRELLQLGERYGSIPKQAEALTWLTTASAAMGDFAEAQHTGARARELLSRLPAGHHLQAQARSMEAAFTYCLDGDWAALAQIWTESAASPPAELSWFALLGAAGGAFACCRSGNHSEAQRLLDSLTPLIEPLEPTIWLLNAVVCVASGAIWELAHEPGWTSVAERLAPTYHSLALRLIAAEVPDYPVTSNELAAARMAVVLGRLPEAETLFARARVVLDASGQRPLRGIVDFDEAQALLRTGCVDRARVVVLLETAEATFLSLGMDAWAARSRALRSHLAPTTRPRTARPRRADSLSPREVEVLELLMAGQSNNQIAAQLVLSVRTVERHLANIYNKIGVRDRRDAAGYARTHAVGDPR